MLTKFRNSGSLLKSGTIVKSGSVINKTTLSADTTYTTDRIITTASTLKKGSTIAANSIINGITWSKTVTTADMTLDSDQLVKPFIPYNKDIVTDSLGTQVTSTKVKVGSTWITGSIWLEDKMQIKAFDNWHYTGIENFVLEGTYCAGGDTPNWTYTYESSGSDNTKSIWVWYSNKKLRWGESNPFSAGVDSGSVIKDYSSVFTGSPEYLKVWVACNAAGGGGGGGYGSVFSGGGGGGGGGGAGCLFAMLLADLNIENYLADVHCLRFEFAGCGGGAGGGNQDGGSAGTTYIYYPTSATHEDGLVMLFGGGKGYRSTGGGSNGSGGSGGNFSGEIFPNWQNLYGGLQDILDGYGYGYAGSNGGSSGGGQNAASYLPKQIDVNWAWGKSSGTTITNGNAVGGSNGAGGGGNAPVVGSTGGWGSSSATSGQGAQGPGAGGGGGGWAGGSGGPGGGGGYAKCYIWCP